MICGTPCVLHIHSHKLCLRACMLSIDTQATHRATTLVEYVSTPKPCHASARHASTHCHACSCSTHSTAQRYTWRDACPRGAEGQATALTQACPITRVEGSLWHNRAFQAATDVLVMPAAHLAVPESGTMVPRMHLSLAGLSSCVPFSQKQPKGVGTLTAARATAQLASAATILTSWTSFIIFLMRDSGSNCTRTQAQAHRRSTERDMEMGGTGGVRGPKAPLAQKRGESVAFAGRKEE